MRTIHREVVSAVLESRDGRFLQALKPENGPGVYPGCWGIIGGGVKEGEDFRTALDREVREETGIDISSYPADLIDEASGESEKTLKDSGERVLCEMQFHTYRVVIEDRDADDIPVVLDDEHEEYRWVLPSELAGLTLTPPSVELYQRLGYL